MQVTLFLSKIHDKHLDHPDFRRKLRAAIVDAFGLKRCDVRFESSRTKQFPIRFQYRSNPQPKLLIEIEILTSGYMKDFYQEGIGLAIQQTLRERHIDDDIPGCEIELSVTMKTSLVI